MGADVSPVLPGGGDGSEAQSKDGRELGAGVVGAWSENIV